MKFGLKKTEFDFILQNVVQPLEKLGASVWCYGSRARGDHQQFSDLDLMIESDVDLQRQIGSIQEFLEKSNFPYKVDLVQHRDFAESYKPGYQKDKVRF